jgi:hypothetical protein
MKTILSLSVLILLVVLFNNLFTNIENLENNNKNNSACLSKDPLYLSINNASQINILSKEVNKLQGLKKKVDSMDDRINVLQKGVTNLTTQIGNKGFSNAGRNMKTVQNPPPNVNGLN